MATLVKPLRLDEILVEKVEELKMLYKSACGFDFTTNSLLQGMIIKGMGKELSLLNMILNAQNVTDDNDNPIVFTKEQKDKLEELKQWYDDYTLVS